MLSIKSIIKIRAAAKALQLLNVLTAVVSGFLMFGTVGTQDYAVYYHIDMTAAEERALWIRMFLCLIIMTATALMAGVLGNAVDWLDNCIRYRRARERRMKIEQRVYDNRQRMNIAVN